VIVDAGTGKVLAQGAADGANADGGD